MEKICTLISKMPNSSFTGVLPLALEFHEWRNAGNESGSLQMAARRLLVEPVFILTALLTAVETVVRAILTFVLAIIGKCLPEGERKENYFENIVKPCAESVQMNAWISTLMFKWIVANISQEQLNPGEDGIDFEHCCDQ